MRERICRILQTPLISTPTLMHKEVRNMKKLTVFVLVVCLTLLAGAALAQQQAPATAAPAVKAAPPAAKDAPAPAAGLMIARMEIASSVENREPAGIAATFPATQEKVYCFLEFQNVPAETPVTVVWTLGPNEMGKVPLTIKPFSKFRTWANKTIGGMKGDWKVDVVDASGTVLKSAAFKIE
jgi:hypothetical protein